MSPDELLEFAKELQDSPCCWIVDRHHLIPVSVHEYFMLPRVWDEYIGDIIGLRYSDHPSVFYPMIYDILYINSSKPRGDQPIFPNKEEAFAAMLCLKVKT